MVQVVQGWSELLGSFMLPAVWFLQDSKRTAEKVAEAQQSDLKTLLCYYRYYNIEYLSGIEIACYIVINISI